MDAGRIPGRIFGQAAAVIAFGIAMAIAPVASAGDLGAAYASLSPGNRIIARTIHDAQIRYRPGAAPPWTLEQIASARSSGHGWDEIFKVMQAAGLIAAGGLDELLSAYQRPHVIKATEQKSGTGVTSPGNDAEVSGGGAESGSGKFDKSGTTSSFAGDAGAATAGFPASGGGGVSGDHGHGRGR